MSDSEDGDLDKMATKLENSVPTRSISRPTNTIISCLEMVDKSTNTESLIVITPNEILDPGEKLLEKHMDCWICRLH